VGHRRDGLHGIVRAALRLGRRAATQRAPGKFGDEVVTGARASARFNVRKSIDFWKVFGSRKLKRRERRAPFIIYEMSPKIYGQRN
jgi:hypothetical protein